MAVAHNFGEKARTNDVLISESVDFAGLLLSKPVLNGLKNAGFERPSPIQLKAIPLGRCGLDLIVQAKSGTGKTCVFSVVALEGIEPTARSTQVLVLAPTREIALQIWEVIRSIGSAMPDLRCHTFIGGLPLHEDKKKLQLCHIAVGTPGRIQNLIDQGMLKTQSIRLFVLDEADKLLEEGFQPQINWIYWALPTNKQMLALSATYPEYLADHLTFYMRNPTFVRLNITDPTLLGIKQYYMSVASHPLPHRAFELKTAAVVKLLSSISFHQCLIFSNLQTRAQNLESELNSQGWPTTCIAGCLQQKDRINAMAKLKSYKCRVLISTDLTSRGIDADKVNLVINLDVPRDHETYLHRIGRAGRFGSYGAGVTIVGEGQEMVDLQTIERRITTHILPLPDPIPSDLVKRQLQVNLEDVVSTEQLATQLDKQGLQHQSHDATQIVGQAGTQPDSQGLELCPQKGADTVYEADRAEESERGSARPASQDEGRDRKGGDSDSRGLLNGGGDGDSQDEGRGIEDDVDSVTQGPQNAGGGDVTGDGDGVIDVSSDGGRGVDLCAAERSCPEVCSEDKLFHSHHSPSLSADGACKEMILCHVDGDQCVATDTCHVDGDQCVATDTCHADGDQCVATDTCHVDGDQCVATDTCHVDGDQCVATEGVIGGQSKVNLCVDTEESAEDQNAEDQEHCADGENLCSHPTEPVDEDETVSDSVRVMASDSRGDAASVQVAPLPVKRNVKGRAVADLWTNMLNEQSQNLVQTDESRPDSLTSSDCAGGKKRGQKASKIGDKIELSFESELAMYIAARSKLTHPEHSPQSDHAEDQESSGSRSLASRPVSNAKRRLASGQKEKASPPLTHCGSVSHHITHTQQAGSVSDGNGAVESVSDGNGAVASVSDGTGAVESRMKAAEEEDRLSLTKTLTSTSCMGSSGTREKKLICVNGYVDQNTRNVPCAKQRVKAAGVKNTASRTSRASCQQKPTPLDVNGTDIDDYVRRIHIHTLQPPNISLSFLGKSGRQTSPVTYGSALRDYEQCLEKTGMTTIKTASDIVHQTFTIPPAVDQSQCQQLVQFMDQFHAQLADRRQTSDRDSLNLGSTGRDTPSPAEIEDEDSVHRMSADGGGGEGGVGVKNTNCDDVLSIAKGPTYHSAAAALNTSSLTADKEQASVNKGERSALNKSDVTADKEHPSMKKAVTSDIEQPSVKSGVRRGLKSGRRGGRGPRYHPMAVVGLATSHMLDFTASAEASSTSENTATVQSMLTGDDTPTGGEEVTQKEQSPVFPCQQPYSSAITCSKQVSPQTDTAHKQVSFGFPKQQRIRNGAVSHILKHLSRRHEEAVSPKPQHAVSLKHEDDRSHMHRDAVSPEHQHFVSHKHKEAKERRAEERHHQGQGAIPKCHAVKRERTEDSEDSSCTTSSTSTADDVHLPQQDSAEQDAMCFHNQYAVDSRVKARSKKPGPRVRAHRKEQDDRVIHTDLSSSSMEDKSKHRHERRHVDKSQHRRSVQDPAVVGVDPAHCSSSVRQQGWWYPYAEQDPTYNVHTTQGAYHNPAEMVQAQSWSYSAHTPHSHPSVPPYSPGVHASVYPHTFPQHGYTGGYNGQGFKDWHQTNLSNAAFQAQNASYQQSQQMPNYPYPYQQVPSYPFQHSVKSGSYPYPFEQPQSQVAGSHPDPYGQASSYPRQQPQSQVAGSHPYPYGQAPSYPGQQPQSQVAGSHPYPYGQAPSYPRQQTPSQVAGSHPYPYGQAPSYPRQQPPSQVAGSHPDPYGQAASYPGQNTQWQGTDSSHSYQPVWNGQVADSYQHYQLAWNGQHHFSGQQNNCQHHGMMGTNTPAVNPSSMDSLACVQAATANCWHKYIRKMAKFYAKWCEQQQ